ncbi:hypothetical protein ACFXHA_33470 [Nocardia sp. NPDC059240]|uniref:hypothetical protein n=1 Tax=Nocardia sp. NPDC059240 TaxID=3346786 RepID=UPI003694B27B
MSSARSRRGALAILMVLAVLMAGIAVTALVTGTRHLTRPVTCAGVVMGALDGCDVTAGSRRHPGEVQVYRPGGFTAGMAQINPADRPLRSRDQMRDRAHTNGVIGLLVGAATVIALIPVGRKIIRRWPQPRDHRT